uniref:Uncharacterized protein n=1 Tax=Arundo donax TaxID=35708 RepID=A0A0A9DLW6_ARUDO
MTDRGSGQSIDTQ